MRWTSRTVNARSSHSKTGPFSRGPEGDRFKLEELLAADSGGMQRPGSFHQTVVRKL